MLLFPIESVRILDTQRLHLRKFAPNDAEDLVELFGDVEVMRFLQGVKTRLEIEQWLTLVFESYRKKNFGPWAILSKNKSGLMGYCGLYLQQNVDGRNEIELLYSLKKRYWGKGYATEAARAVHQYGRTQLGLTRFVSLVAAGNIASTAVAKKVGMTMEKEIVMWGRTCHLYSI